MGAERRKRRTQPGAGGGDGADAAPKAEPIRGGGGAAVEIPDSITVGQLAGLLRSSPTEIIKQLMRSGIMASVNQSIGYEAAAAVAQKLDYRPVPKGRAAPGEAGRPGLAGPAETAGRPARAPVVVVMGHVDHGKTQLLDAIRHTSVAASEPGAITQHIGAYRVNVHGQSITFLDTPGHEAFTAMRARGAHVADVAILVVAADDGVMPQTREAISHARAAGLPIVVAINKIDRPEANPQMVKQQLADSGLVVEEWGGDTVAVEVSARAGTGIADLLENLLVVAEMEELTAAATGPAEGVVIEAGLHKNRGPVATVLVRRGTLRSGDTVVAGEVWGRVRAMFDDFDRRVTAAGPADPVVLMGLGGVPQVGDQLTVVDSEAQARAMVEGRLRGAAVEQARPVSLAALAEQIGAGKVKELSLVLKADVAGSIQPVQELLERLSTETVRVRTIHSGTGSVTESDIMLAIASNALVLGFGVGADPGARQLAETKGVDVRSYSVIYDLVSDVEQALKGLVEPVYVEATEGRGEVIATFPLGKRITVGGVKVLEGKASLGAMARVLRQGRKVADSSVSSLKHFKESVKEMPAGSEVGVVLSGFNEFQIGDILEFYRKRRVE